MHATPATFPQLSAAAAAPHPPTHPHPHQGGGGGGYIHVTQQPHNSFLYRPSSSFSSSSLPPSSYQDVREEELTSSLETDNSHVQGRWVGGWVGGKSKL